MSSTRSFLAAIESALRRHDVPRHRVCIGLSGGIDSVVLLESLARLAATLDLQLSALHVHHGLSVNADRWVAFCEALCEGKSIPLKIARISVDRSLPGGIEAVARAARYAAFNEVDADFLALAQHADDQAETVLHQILRGTGLKGMAGMGAARHLRDGLVAIRPMLEIPRTGIEAFAGEHRLDWIEDESNADIVFTRNFIRHAVTPKLAERFPQFRESLARAGRHAAEANEMLAALAAIDLKWDGRHAHADLLDELPPMRQTNALYYWLHWQQPAGERQYPLPSRTQLEEWAQQLFRPAPGNKPHQAGGHDFTIYRRKDLLLLERK